MLDEPYNAPEDVSDGVGKMRRIFAFIITALILPLIAVVSICLVLGSSRAIDQLVEEQNRIVP